MTTWDSAQAPGAVGFSHALFPGVTLRDLSSNHSQILEGTRPWTSASSYQRYSAVPHLRSQVEETQFGVQCPSDSRSLGYPLEDALSSDSGNESQYLTGHRV